MCLSNIKGPFIAEKDIRCYKHFKTVAIKGEERLTSPYREFIWPKKGMRSKIKVNKRESSIDNGLHAYVHKVAAETDKALMFSDVVKTMYIPKGAIYYKGTFDGDSCYAANKMMFK